MIKILGALLSDGVNAAGCLFGQRLAPATGTVRQAALGGKRLKIYFLDMDLSADIRPAPFIGQIDARQDPRLDLFPGVYGQKFGCGAA